MVVQEPSKWTIVTLLARVVDAKQACCIEILYKPC